MGKWSNLKSELTKFEPEPTYQEKVTTKKVEIKSAILACDEKIGPNSIGQVLINARMEKTRLETLVKEQNLVIAAMEQELIDYLEGGDLLLVRLNNGVTLSINDDIYCQVSDKEAFHQWIRKNHLEDLFSVHYQTMASMVKERLNSDEDAPPGITPYFKQSIRVRGIKDLEKEG